MPRASYAVRRETLAEDLAALDARELERVLFAAVDRLERRDDLPTDVRRRLRGAALALNGMRKVEVQNGADA